MASKNCFADGAEEHAFAGEGRLLPLRRLVARGGARGLLEPLATPEVPLNSPLGSPWVAPAATRTAEASRREAIQPSALLFVRASLTAACTCPAYALGANSEIARPITPEFYLIQPHLCACSATRAPGRRCQERRLLRLRRRPRFRSPASLHCQRASPTRTRALPSAPESRVALPIPLAYWRITRQIAG